MSVDDDAAKLYELGRGLSSTELDGPTAERLAQRARDELGRGLPRARWIVPIVTALVTAAYALWTVEKLAAILR